MSCSAFSSRWVNKDKIQVYPVQEDLIDSSKSGNLGIAEVFWLQLFCGLPFLVFLSVLYVESCHQQLWQVLSLLFHAFWHWNGWIIVNFFLNKILILLVSVHWWILFHFLFPLSLCASLDMAHRGVLRCVSPAQFSLFLFFWLRLDDMVYTCDTPLLLSKHGWLCRLLPPCLAWLPYTGGFLEEEVPAMLKFLLPFQPLSLV